MITKLPFSRLSGRILLRAYVSSIPTANYIQKNPLDDQNPPNSFEIESTIHSLKNKLLPETLIHVLSSTNDLNSSLRLFSWASLQNRFRHTTDTYSHIIMRLGLASRVDEMEGFCYEMVKKTGFSASEEALLGLLDIFIRYHKVDEALRVLFVLNSLSYNSNLSIELINRLLGVLVEEKKGLQSVLFVYKEMVKSSIVPTTETLNNLLQALFDADRINAVLDQYKRMQRKNCCPNSRTYEIMVSGLIGNNLLNEALVVLDEILEIGCDLESSFFSHVIPLLFRMNRHDVGLRLFEKMKASKVVPDLSVYEVLIHYFSKNQCLDDAINHLNDMINVNLNPSDHVFVDLVDGFCSLNKFSEAKMFLEDKHVTEASSYNVLLNGYCQAFEFLEVMQLFQEMVAKNLTDSLSWNIMIRYLSESRRSDLVHTVLGRMIVSISMPDSITYSALIVLNCKSKEVDDALNLFHCVREEHWVVDSSCYNTLIQTLCQFGKIQEAVDVFRYMSYKKCTLRASCYSMLIRRLCLIGKVNQAINLMTLGYYSGLFCSNEDYNMIMKGLSKSSLSKHNDFLVIVGRMVVEGCPLDSEAYNELINSMSLHDRAIECGLFLDLMVKKGLLPETEVLANSVTCLAEKLKLHIVMPAIYKLFSDHDEVVNPAICNVLINGLWKEGYKDEAHWLLDVMLGKGWVPDGMTHRLLINGNSDNGDSEVFVHEKYDKKDEIISILLEGFGEL